MPRFGLNASLLKSSTETSRGEQYPLKEERLLVALARLRARDTENRRTQKEELPSVVSPTPHLV
jgi:hypothetical protein